MNSAHSTDTAARPVLTGCPNCGATNFRPVRTVDGFQVVACPACALQFSNPQPSDAELSRIYGPNYFLDPDTSLTAGDIARMKEATADLYLDLVEKVRPARGQRLLEIGCGHGDLLVAAQRRGYAVTGVEYSEHACLIARGKLKGGDKIHRGEVSALPAGTQPFDVVVACDVIEHVRDPQAFLRDAHRHLAPGGLLLIATPSLDSWSARLMRKRWMEYKPEHLTYFSPLTLETVLRRSGFEVIARHPGRKMLSLDYVAGHFARFPIPGLSPLVGFIQRSCPRRLRNRLWQVVASGIVTIARRPPS